MKNYIFTIQLRYHNAPPALVTIATHDDTRIPKLVQENKVWWERVKPVRNWVIKGVNRDTLRLTDDQYDAAMARCDVVDTFDEDVLVKDRPEPVPLIPEIPERPLTPETVTNPDTPTLPGIGEAEVQNALFKKGLI